VLQKAATVTGDDRTGGAPLSSRVAADETARILASVGAVPYQWDLASDALAWGDNVRDV
jgi:hypothetical protein